MDNYVMFRRPEERKVFSLYSSQPPEKIKSLKALDNKTGFVIAPFETDKKSPILLLHIEKTEVLSMDTEVGNTENTECVNTLDDGVSQYMRNFESISEKLDSEKFLKIVLARKKDVKRSIKHYESLFYKACRLYPHQFICLINTVTSGVWLMATPELLLSGNSGKYSTMALAGTMRNACEWSDKNRAEQQYVSDYINDVLCRNAIDVKSNSPHTVMAADLYHLCTDFSFHLSDSSSLGSLLAALHPTPAVCGIPADITKEYIISHEGFDRGYYSGFCGMLNPGDTAFLYVSLRCMKIMRDMVSVYAGGGLIKGSIVDDELRETEYKMHSMLRIL